MITCICCGINKPVECFHKHKKMSSGRLNKCKECVYIYIKQWRLANPDVRKLEHIKVRKRKGFKTRQEYLEERKKNAIGRAATMAKYGHKRRSKTKQFLTEFDSFVIEEASKLSKLRESITGFSWHLDHIVPLMHKKASGLHNGFNIQVVPASWNVQKGNRSMEKYLGS